MHSYFKLYENYYNNLVNNKNIVQLSNELSSICLSYKNSINNTLEVIKNSNWFEKGKTIITNQIFLDFNNKLENLSNFISKNLVNACNLSINSLLPKLELLKNEDVNLSNLNNTLIDLQNNYNSLKNNCPSPKIMDNTTNTLINNPNYIEWKTKINYLATNISNTQLEIKKLILTIEKICEESNQIIKTILMLNGDISDSEVKSLLPSYTTSLNFLDINSDLENIILNTETTITIEQLLSDSKGNHPLLPFVINERKIEYAKDGGLRFSFTYKNNNVNLEGIVLLPPNTTKNNKNIFTFYSGSGGVYIDTLNKEFHNTNPPYPMIIFGRNEKNGGMVNNVIQDSTQIEATTSAIDAFKNYLGTNDSKVHAIGHSMGAIELNQIVADKPNYFASATFINGRIRYTSDQDRLNSYQNTTTKLNAFVSTNDEQVPLKEQFSSYTEAVDININYHTIAYDSETKKVGFGNNKIANYTNIMFDDIKNGLPEKLVDNYPNITNKASNNKATMDIYVIDGASHTGFLPSCFPNQEFYNLILKNTF